MSAWLFADNYFPKSHWWRTTGTFTHWPAKKPFLAVVRGCSAGQSQHGSAGGGGRDRLCDWVQPTHLHAPHPPAWKSIFGLSSEWSTTVTSGDKTAWGGVLPPPHSPNATKHALCCWDVRPRLSFSEENAGVIKVKTTSFHDFFITEAVWSFWNQMPNWPARQTVKKMWKTTSKKLGALCTLGFCFDLSPA